MHPPRPSRALALALVLLVLQACGSPPEQASPSPGASRPPPSRVAPGPSTVPPVPSAPGQGLGPNQPPIVWVGGQITALKADRLEVAEAFGSVLTLRRLGGGATSFFRVTAGRWERTDRAGEVDVGTKACVETLMDGQTLLALRVFLGADCGPVA